VATSSSVHCYDCSVKVREMSFEQLAAKLGDFIG
jgi:hypothetical protein